MITDTTKSLLQACLFILILHKAQAQEHIGDTLVFSALNKSKISFILDDTYVIGGINTSGIYYSNHFRDLSYRGGFSIGVEQYFPLRGKVFLSSGIGISQRNFSYQRMPPGITVKNLYLDVPVTAAFELPILKELDFRIFVGGAIGIRLSSNIRGDYEALLSEHPELFVYQNSDFHNGDYGWHFGLSAEYNDILFRFRSYSGFIKFDQKDQGMMSSFSVEVGYFLFRSMQK